MSDTARVERYAQAIYEAQHPAMRAETTPDDWRSEAQAALSVADAENPAAFGLRMRVKRALDGHAWKPGGCACGWRHEVLASGFVPGEQWESHRLDAVVDAAMGRADAQ